VEEFWKTVPLLRVSKQRSKRKIGNRREQKEMLMD
jgi:hypothetical protein